MKIQNVTFGEGKHLCSGVLAIPEKKKNIGVVLAHGAGAGMDHPFMRFFHMKIAEAGFACLRFNFPYINQKRKVPDPQPVLTSSFQLAIKQMPTDRVAIGGKSMGGRMASYIASEEKVVGLFFLGYPLHPPGKPELLRDQHLYAISKPLFFASGTRDPFATHDLLKKTIRKIGNNVTTEFIENGGHSFEVPKSSGKSTNQVQESVADSLIRWLIALEP